MYDNWSCFQISATAGLGSDGGLYGRSVLPGALQNEATVSRSRGQLNIGVGQGAELNIEVGQGAEFKIKKGQGQRLTWEQGRGQSKTLEKGRVKHWSGARGRVQNLKGTGVEFNIGAGQGAE